MVGLGTEQTCRAPSSARNAFSMGIGLSSAQPPKRSISIDRVERCLLRTHRCKRKKCLRAGLRPSQFSTVTSNAAIRGQSQLLAHQGLRVTASSIICRQSLKNCLKKPRRCMIRRSNQRSLDRPLLLQADRHLHRPQPASVKEQTKSGLESNHLRRPALDLALHLVRPPHPFRPSLQHRGPFKSEKRTAKRPSLKIRSNDRKLPKKTEDTIT